MTARDVRFHIRKVARMKGKRCREKRERERERKTCGWKRLPAYSGVASSGTASSDAVGSGTIGIGVADNENGSVVGMKMGRERKENVKKERKRKEKRKEKTVSRWQNGKRK